MCLLYLWQSEDTSKQMNDYHKGVLSWFFKKSIQDISRIEPPVEWVISTMCTRAQLSIFSHCIAIACYLLIPYNPSCLKFCILKWLRSWRTISYRLSCIWVEWLCNYEFHLLFCNASLTTDWLTSACESWLMGGVFFCLSWLWFCNLDATAFLYTRSLTYEKKMRRKYMTYQLNVPIHCVITTRLKEGFTIKTVDASKGTLHDLYS